MKKVLIHVLSLAMLFSMAACGRQASATQPTAEPTQESETIAKPTQAPEASAAPVEVPAAIEEETTEMTSEESPAEVGVFDLKRGVVLLNSGHEMPILGIGCFLFSTPTLTARRGPIACTENTAMSFVTAPGSRSIAEENEKTRSRICLLEWQIRDPFFHYEYQYFQGT